MKKTKWLVVLLAVIIHLYFYVSAFKTHALDRYFLPTTQGQDFFQIPNAAYSFLRGGDLQGNLNGLKNSYANCCGVNTNVYHPFFTLLVGTPLQLFSPWTAFNLWGPLHLLVDVFIVVFLIKKFRNNPHLPLALVIYLVSSFSYYEILNNQYHFLLNLATFLLLYELSLGKDNLKTGLYFFASLIVKPLGIFWLIPLFIRKKYKTAFLGGGIFLACSLSFLLIPEGKYYFENIAGMIRGGNFNWDFFSVLNFLGIGIKDTKSITIPLAILISLLSFSPKFKIQTLLGLWIIFSLVFFQGTYPYHFSILGFIIPLLILLEKIDGKIIKKACLFFVIAPAPIAIITPLLLSTTYAFDQLNIARKFVFLAWSYTGVILLFLLIIKQRYLKSK